VLSQLHPIVEQQYQVASNAQLVEGIKELSLGE
jgi:hypothetical protein